MARDAGVLDDVWTRTVALLREAAPDGASGALAFLDRIEPLALRAGTLELATRGPRAAPLLRQRLVPLIERAASRVAGTPLRVRLEVDLSLGGALRTLGLRPRPLPAPRAPFVVSSETRVAHAALLDLARRARPEFDVVVLEGPPDVGKSHLLARFASERLRRHPRERWRVERGVDLFRDFSAACRDGSRSTFRGERVACDGWVLDGVHELSGKLACQGLLVEMLEYLRSRGRLVLLSGEPLRGGAREILPSLRSLLRAGLRLVIPQLSAQARAAILEARVRDSAGTRRGELDGGPAAGFVGELAAATEIPLSRCIEALRRAGLRAIETGRPVQRGDLEARLGGPFPKQGAEPFDRLLDLCARFAGVERSAIVEGKRTRAAALGRHLAIYLALVVFRIQRSTVRRWLGAISPSVLPYARAKVDAMRARDARLDGFIRESSEEIGRGQRFLFR